MTIELKSSAAVPSFTHAYSIITEVATKWFLEKFSKEYFKTIHIEGKHVLDDFRSFDFHDLIKKGKPAVAILPTISFDYDRDGLDTSMYGLDHIMNQMDTINRSFFKNVDKGTFVAMQMEEMEVRYRYKIRVESRAQQVDLFRWMKVAFRIGHNETIIINPDYHVPYGLVLQLAKDNGYEVKNGVITKINEFLSFINSISEVPFTLKLRTISGQCEFFIRFSNINIQIDTRDRLSIDDGELQGRLDNNFHIEMEVTMRMPSPMLYFYYSTEPHDLISTTSSGNGSDTLIYNIETIQITNIPEKNSKGWGIELKGPYMEENILSPVVIDIEGIIDMIGCRSIVDHNNLINVSNNIFLDFVVYSHEEVVPCSIDWPNMKITLNNLVDSPNMFIVVYMDGIYAAEQLKVIDKIDKDRLI